MSNNDIDVSQPPKTYGTVLIILSLIYSIFYIPGIILMYEFLYPLVIIPYFSFKDYKDHSQLEKLLAANLFLLPIHLIALLAVRYMFKAKASKIGVVWSIISLIIILSNIIVMSILIGDKAFFI